MSKKGSGMSATQASKHTDITERGTASTTIETQFQLKVHSIHYRVQRKGARRFVLSLSSGLNKLPAQRDAQRRDTKKSSRPKFL